MFFEELCAKLLVLGHTVDNALGRLEGAQGRDQQVLMLNEQAVVLDRVAERLDLVSDLGLVLEGRVDGQVALVASVVKELDGPRVAVAVDVAPSPLHGLHPLVDLPVEVDLFGLADEVRSREA